MISVAVIGAQTSGNLGAISRVMANFNIRKLYLIKPECEVITDESKARAMRAFNILENAELIESLEEIKADYLIATSAKTGTAHNLRRVYVTPEDLSKNINSSLHYCIVLGREDVGLLNEEVDACDLMLHIRTSKDYKTLNISHALTIILYELFKQEGQDFEHVASKSERRAVLITLTRAAEHLDSFEDFKEVFKGLMNRAFIRKKEARALAGLFKHIKDE